ncbi:hypothetical protein TrVE_jg2971 [Triparma verrucosa]|uniref:Uncharacterized protein n=1 Tax=Triparma verrucosa TaxID=1606542 RepID=A0A9W7KTZ8_9STRA|nr:hypothetical protein TrVE_jg2971 [Triparma verrucosa]
MSSCPKLPIPERFLPLYGLVSALCFLTQTVSLCLSLFTDVLHPYQIVIDCLTLTFHFAIGTIGMWVEIKKVAWVEIWCPFLHTYGGKGLLHFLFFILIGGGYGPWYDILLSIPIAFATFLFFYKHFEAGAGVEAITIK